MRQVQAQRYAKANPRLKVNANIHHTYNAPIAQFNYIDGTEVRPHNFVYLPFANVTRTLSNKIFVSVCVYSSTTFDQNMIHLLFM
jgi:hypothetical protein